MTRLPFGGASGPSDSEPPEHGVAARRCRMTLLFADLCDYTSLSEACDPEEVAELRQRLMEMATEVITKHRGLVNQVVGDGIQALFGFPDADEDEVRHAISAALELGERARLLEGRAPLPFDFHLRMHSAVHSGLVFASSGDPRHGRFQITGDAVNTAARLCSAAGRGEVIVSAATLEGFEGFFETERAESLTLKGKKQPVEALRVLASLPEKTRFQARAKVGLSPYVGREAELQRVEAALERAAAGRGEVLCIVGDAGLGKTRLMEEVRQRARRAGFRVHRGHCESYGGFAPLRPFLQITRELVPTNGDLPLEQRTRQMEQALQALDETLREHVPAMLQLLSLRADASTESRSHATISAVTAVLEALMSQGPTLLLFDDWQWSDGASLQVLGRVLRALPEHPCLCLVAARELANDDVILGDAARLHLPPLSEAEALLAAEALLGEQPSESTLKSVLGRSGGNPLFLEELCGALKRKGGAQGRDLEQSVPNTVHALLRARVEALPAADARLLGVASVIGTEFHNWLLSQVADTPDVEARLLSPELAGLVQPGAAPATCRFKHGLAREVVYETVRVADRRKLHLRIAQALEARSEPLGVSDHYEALALHYTGAGEPLSAAKYAELAGDKAAAVSALDGARSQYTAALGQLDLLSPSTELQSRWLDIVIKWSASSVYYPAREQLAVLSRAAEHAKRLCDDGRLAWIEHWTGWLYYALGGADAAIERLDRSLTLATKLGDTRLAAQALTSIGQCHAVAGRYEAALEHLSQGLELKRARPPVGVGGAYGLGCQGLVLGDRGAFATAYDCLDEALGIVADTGNALEGSLLGLRGMVQIWQGAWGEALETSRRGKATGERVNGPYVLAMCQAIAGYARFRMHDDVSALDELRRAVDWLERRDIHLFLSFCYGHLALGELRAERYAAARTYAERAIDRARHGEPLGEAMGYRALARLAVANGDFAEARRHCEQARASGAQRGSPREAALASFALGRIERDARNLPLARDHLGQALDAFRTLDMQAHAQGAEALLLALPHA